MIAAVSAGNMLPLKTSGPASAMELSQRRELADLPQPSTITAPRESQSAQNWAAGNTSRGAVPHMNFATLTGATFSEASQGARALAEARDAARRAFDRATQEYQSASRAFQDAMQQSMSITLKDSFGNSSNSTARGGMPM